MSMRERALSMKTLLCFLQGLEGSKTTVNFRDESSVTGRLDRVDGYMNIEMSDVTYTAASGTAKDFSQYCCQGKFIRYVEIPDDVDPIKVIEDRVDVLRRMKPTTRGGRGGRGGRGRGGRGGGGRGGRGSRGGGGGGSYRPRPSYGGSSSYGGGSYGGGSSRYGSSSDSSRYGSSDRYGSAYDPRRY